MVEFRCKNCRWFDHQHRSLKDPDIPERYGYCRKHRPAVYMLNNRHYGGWPLVDIDDLCGEFRTEED